MTKPFKASALFISDSHAFHPQNGGLRKQAKILAGIETEKLFFVGDIKDVEAVVALLNTYRIKLENFPKDFSKVIDILRHGFPEIDRHIRFIDMIFERIREGVQVVYTPGNHDENMDAFHGQDIQGLEIRKDTIYDAGGGRKSLVAHGHRFDLGWLQKDHRWYRMGSRVLEIGMAFDHKAGKMISSLEGSFIVANALKACGKFYIGLFKKTP